MSGKTVWYVGCDGEGLDMVVEADSEEAAKRHYHDKTDPKTEFDPDNYEATEAKPKWWDNPEE